MLRGEPATEQCVIIDGVNFLNNADVDGQAVPPPGAPNIIMAAGGTQLKKVLEDDGLYWWQFHVDWQDPTKTGVIGPTKIPVAPYHYLCGGQLTNCVPQPDTTRRLDAQGDKIMQRLVYRNLGDHEAIVAVHSVDSAAAGGGVRWYEFRLDSKRVPVLYQQSTYAPDGLFRWMASPGMDRAGNIGIGYSFGGATVFPGQRFAGRLANDPLNQLTTRETVLVEGQASQSNAMRWEDYTTTAMDPSDDCTFWYVGDYVKAGATTYSSKIGAFRLPGCITGTVSGSAFFDRNHNGKRDPGEPGMPNQRVADGVTSGADGSFRAKLSADPAYGDFAYTIGGRTIQLSAGQEVGGIEVPATCEVRAFVVDPGGRRKKAVTPEADVNATIHDPIVGDWPTVGELFARAKGKPAYAGFLDQLSRNQAAITPANPERCK